MATEATFYNVEAIDFEAINLTTRSMEREKLWYRTDPIAWTELNALDYTLGNLLEDLKTTAYAYLGDDGWKMLATVENMAAGAQYMDKANGEADSAKRLQEYYGEPSMTSPEESRQTIPPAIELGGYVDSAVTAQKKIAEKNNSLKDGVVGLLELVLVNLELARKKAEAEMVLDQQANTQVSKIDAEGSSMVVADKVVAGEIFNQAASKQQRIVHRVDDITRRIEKHRDDLTRTSVFSKIETTQVVHKQLRNIAA